MMFNTLLGRLVKRRRKARGLTIDTLSKITGVKTSVISRCERAEGGISSSAFYSLAVELKIEISDIDAELSVYKEELLTSLDQVIKASEDVSPYT